MVVRASLLPLIDTCASIIANGTAILMESVFFHVLNTAVRKMREYHCFWRRYHNHGAFSRDPYDLKPHLLVLIMMVGPDWQPIMTSWTAPKKPNETKEQINEKQN